MYLGIEIGGTKLQLAVGEGTSAQLIRLERCSVVPQYGAQGILKQIEQVAPTLLAQRAITRIGLGFGGPVQNGIVTKSHQIHGWENFPLAAWCQEKFGLPAIVGNDCDAAALAEASIGAGAGAATVFYVTVGTGVGGGLVSHGRLQGQGRPAIAEIGHLRPGLEATAPQQTVESLASGWGIVNTARNLASRLTASERQLLQQRIGAPEEWTAKALASAAADGEPLATTALDEGLRALGWAIAQVITLVAPDVIVVGGGVSLMGDRLFFGPLRQQVERYVFPPLAGAYKIVPAALGEEAVVHGALALAANPYQ